MSARTITVLVGTDHHPFTRLVEWADSFQRASSEDVVTVQYGYSAPPVVARGYECFTIDDLRETVRRSDIVITHGGPGTIMDVRAGGHHPIILGRDPGLGEHVDNHQLLFVQWASSKGLGSLVQSTSELQAYVEALGPEGTRRAPAYDRETSATARAVAELVASSRVPNGDRSLRTRWWRPATRPRGDGPVPVIPEQRKRPAPDVAPRVDNDPGLDKLPA